MPTRTPTVKDLLNMKGEHFWNTLQTFCYDDSLALQKPNQATNDIPNEVTSFQPTAKDYENLDHLPYQSLYEEDGTEVEKRKRNNWNLKRIVQKRLFSNHAGSHDNIATHETAKKALYAFLNRNDKLYDSVTRLLITFDFAPVVILPTEAEYRLQYQWASLWVLCTSFVQQEAYEGMYPVGKEFHHAWKKNLSLLYLIDLRVLHHVQAYLEFLQRYYQNPTHPAIDWFSFSRLYHPYLCEGTFFSMSFLTLLKCPGIPVVQLSSSPSDGPTINTPGHPPNSVSGELSAIIFESTANPVHVIARLTLTLDTLNSSWPYIANRDDAEIIRQFAGVLSNDPRKAAFIRNIRVAALFRQIMEMKGEAAPNKTGGANGGLDGGAIGVVDEIAVGDGDEGAAGGAVGGVDEGAIGDTDGEASKGGDGRDGEGGEPNEPRPIEDEDERRQGDSETNDHNGERSLAEQGSLSSDSSAFESHYSGRPYYWDGSVSASLDSVERGRSSRWRFSKSKRSPASEIARKYQEV
ncbi:hypothetical protein C8R42DRAFT_727647 [Lentinula raphanica]|nr:hypothetical protein C8R42DRAFT_727647 [Lentinula raphanica]